jgi:Flp pilus assembly CpaE family ATPase
MRARMILVVFTPERPSIELLRRRCAELISRGIDPLRLVLVVNRWHESDPTIEELSETLGRPVVVALPNDYPVLRRATDNQGFVEADTELGRAYLRLARRIAGLPAEVPVEEPKARKKPFSLAALLRS